MNKTNACRLKALLLLCTIALPFNSLLPARRLANNTVPRARTSSAILIRKKTVAPIKAIDEEADEQNMPEQTETDATTVEDTKEARIAAPTPGLLATLYLAAVPVILFTLNTAIGTGIGTFSGTFIKGAIKRNSLLEATAREYPTLHPSLIAKAVAEEPGGSYSSILSNATYAAMITAAISPLAKLAEMGGTMILQNFMPSQ
jgi:hypothetical protein